MKKIGKIALKEAQVMSDVEMKNVVGGNSGDSGGNIIVITECKMQGQICYYSDGVSGICESLGTGSPEYGCNRYGR